jgi:hypothetical protein
METRLQQYLLEHETLLDDLRLVRSLQLPQCYIAAGYIRNYVWDRLHGYPGRGRHNDIDVVYFDRSTFRKSATQSSRQCSERQPATTNGP